MSIIKPEDVEFIFHSYQIFEDKLINILKTIPLSDENKETWSPELVNLFLDVSSLVDSISRYIVSQGKEDDEDIIIKDETGKNISKVVRDLNVIDFENNLFIGSEITTSNVVIYIYPLKVITPYKTYRMDDGWWKIYNLLKHNRIKNYKKANLWNTINSLAALFLLLVRYKEPEFTNALLRYKFIITSYVPEFVHESRVNLSNHFWYDSELFGIGELDRNIPDDLSQINPPLTSRKFQIFFGRYNNN
jgi:hypothetical protein